MAGGIHRESRGRKGSSVKEHTRKLFSRIRSRTSEKSGIGQAQYSYSLPEGSKLRNVQEDQNYKGSLQKTHWQSCTSSSKFWKLNNSRYQSSQWRMWISKQSPIRSRGTRFGNSMDSSVLVQNNNFTGKRKGVHKSSSSRQKSQKSFTLTIP